MKVLGLDIGTNSIGWGLVDEKNQSIEKCGVYIFPEGVKKEKDNEQSKAAERTKYRSARRLKFRRKLRKYKTLQVLINNQMCPLSLEELDLWRYQKIYPTSVDFINWYRTDEERNWEPYFLRKKCVEQKADKYEIGRALYHLAQRRGFLSNRKDSTSGEDGKVKVSIGLLSKELNGRTLGQYFYELKQSGERVRGRYTSRKEHYEVEFFKICEMQQIDDDLKAQLHNAIFYQRKLKSQKFLVGKCTFETNKPRCPISHFEFEEFRMLSFINSIKVAKNKNEDDVQEKQFLTEDEKNQIVPLFFRKSKHNFPFTDIEKKLKGKNEYWEFNYRKDTIVPSCIVSAQLKDLFGENWKEIVIKQYDIFDIWHVLFDFDDDSKLHEFAIDKLGLDEKDAEKFCKIHFHQGYGNLSLKAIRKILPFLRKGYLYSHAVFLANIPFMIGIKVFEENASCIEAKVKKITESLKERNNIISLANFCIDRIFKDEQHDFHSEEWDKSIIDTQIAEFYGKKKWNDISFEKQREIKEEIERKVEEVLRIATTKNPNDYKYKPLRTDDLIEEYLIEQGFNIKKNEKLYHPSDLDYSSGNPITLDNGKKILGSPRTPSVKNPVAMRALHQLRKLINHLILTGEIDSSTRINIELANEVNDKNWRKAIAEFQKKNETKNEEYRKKLVEHGYEPSETNVKKYRLWVEQHETCPYTGDHIGLNDLFGSHPLYDFEHTIPRSLSYDDSLENITLCQAEYNRNVKKQHIPSELPGYDEIKLRFMKFYEKDIDACLSAIEKNKVKGYVDPAIKDKKIVTRHIAELKLRYLKGKIKRFTASEITSGFTHRQLNDTRIITKFALAYLKSVFDYVQPVNGAMTDLFKRQWGLLDRNEVKDRTNYRHHVVDALTVACVNRGKYNLLCEVIKKSSSRTQLKMAKPWESFDEDVLAAVQYIIPKHFVDDNSLRQSKKILRDRSGKPLLKNGQKVYIKGATARGSLHKDKVFGCIYTVPTKDTESKKIFVLRISCGELSKEKGEKIIDNRIKSVFFENLKSGKQSIADIQTNGILLPWQKEGKSIYAKRIRIKVDDSAPIALKKHYNISQNILKDYKQKYYVKNEENYLIALYRRSGKNGKIISDYLVLNLLEAISRKHKGEDLYPSTVEKKGDTLDLYKVLKIGKIVIMQEHEDEDVFALSKKELFTRIYRVAGIASNPDGRIKFVHTIISSPFSTEVELFDTNIDKFKRISNSKLFCLVEGIDFIITPTGEIMKYD
ncbi:MAG: type II CRISPR RNA-guided endonuclease Cas9 [Treponemataceae bacterium]|nr:type II CRISPR RNA-guided endonuclease Cas9 [Treponemataceae bacterium]